MLPCLSLSADVAPGDTLLSIQCDPSRIVGQRSSMGPALLLSAEIIAPTKVTDLILSGTLSFPDESGGLAIPAQSLLRNRPVLRVPLTDEQIANIERKRNGQQAIFELSLDGVGFIALTAHTPRTLRSSYPISIAIPRDHWHQILADLGHGQRRLVVLPPSPEGRGPLWEAASKQLEAASWRLTAGDPGAAMNEARTATERAIEAIGDAIGARRGAKESSRNYAEKVAAVVKTQHVDRSDDPYALLSDTILLSTRIFEFTSDPIHNGLGSAHAMNAELAISLASALYTYFARLPIATTNSHREKLARIAELTKGKK